MSPSKNDTASATCFSVSIPSDFENSSANLQHRLLLLLSSHLPTHQRRRRRHPLATRCSRESRIRRAANSPTQPAPTRHPSQFLVGVDVAVHITLPFTPPSLSSHAPAACFTLASMPRTLTAKSLSNTDVSMSMASWLPRVTMTPALLVCFNRIIIVSHFPL
ncbi:hypothetical protein FNV43_RR20454 [Rhamnella rubrinervis]|uniref:Uncharacterized protein n=1 Tax=Rhamnella rubrinervis TaxID=2594499 RepID=A0A8K0GUL1_9ROSA|nr:hypothetical protein FNV43_RR20454 [Rhamnella rubrinervis]